MDKTRFKMFKKVQRLMLAGQWEPALVACRSFLKVEPADAEGWTSLGSVCLRTGRFQEAMEACQRALSIDAAQRTARINLGASQIALGRLEAAEATLNQLLALDPGCVGGLLCLAHCLIKQGDPARAEAVLREVGQLEPGNGELPNLLWIASAMQGNWDLVRRYWESRLPADPGCSRDYGESHLCLLFGELPRGWELYESRLGDIGQDKIRWNFTRPRWNGEPFPGRTLLLHWEQGFGDTLMFVRFASRVKALGGRVVLVAQSALADLVATCPGVDQVVPHLGSLPPYDLQAPLLSLPSIFKTDLDHIPADIPYLDLPERVPNRQSLARILAASHGKVRIGIVWAGSSTHGKDEERSIPVDALAPLGDLPGVAWHSFQMEPGPAAPLPGIVPLAPLLANFSDTAYALSGMDLVITVDTALAHLAGALGMPTLLMLPFVPDFRWLLERSDSPWYPTMRIYRQSVPGDWGSVIQRVARDLAGPSDT